MDTNRIKKATEWFYSNVFRDEAIRPKPASPSVKLPSMLRAARSLESRPGGTWQTRESIFMKQGRLLANYEDHFEFQSEAIHYYPTYEALTDEELRGYFSWRTMVRKGDIRKTSLSFAFLYLYELINQIGVSDAMDGYRKLTDFQALYGPLDGRVLPYLKGWRMDYVVYYQLDPALLADTPQVRFDQCITVLDHIHTQDQEQVIRAVKEIAPRWLERSKFYRDYQSDCDAVLFRVLLGVTDHCAARCKDSFVERYFGRLTQAPANLFRTAVFCDPVKDQNCSYAVDERRVYQCRQGFWSVTAHDSISRGSLQLEDLIKTVDSVMREAYGYRYPVKPKLEGKWLLKLIRTETQAHLAKKKAAEAKKITIDYSQLERIRHDAAVTQDRLTVEEELEAEPAAEETVQTAPESPEPEAGGLLRGPEYRLLQCLLYGRDYGWVRAEGLIMSVLLDSINEKLYDEFMDAVVDDTPAVVKDYIDALKEMVQP